MAICVGYMGRLGAVGLRVTRPVLGTSQLRQLSTVGLQRSRLTLARGELRGLQSSSPRSFWSWTKATAVPAAPTVAEKVIHAPEAAPIPDFVPAEAATALDAASATPTPDAVLPAAAPIPTEALPIDFIPSIPPPLNYGDLAALDLAGWTPAGICRWTMELINVSTGLPWFWTIVTTTVLARVVLLPFTVMQMQSTAALAPHQGELTAIRDEMAVAQRKKDMLAMQRAALKQKMIYEKAGVSVPGMAVAPFIQLPVTLGMFFGVKKLCDLPVEQLKWSGFDWIPDLTVIDPTWTLPIIATVLMNVQISVTMRDLVGSTAQMGHIMNGLRLLTTASIFLLANLSNGLLVYLLTSITAMIGQSLLLRQPAVRRAFGIPLIPNHLRTAAPSMRDTFLYVRKWWGNKVAEARVANKR